jgi:universal stress protein A
MKTKTLTRSRTPRSVSQLSASRELTFRLATPALKLRTILVPIDFSNCSMKALDYALALAKDYGAAVNLLSVVEANGAGSEVDSPDIPILEKQLKDNAQKKLDALAKKASRDKVKVATIVRVGQTLREIIETARSTETDLLLISTHARSGLPDFCLGSAAEQIVRYAPCPVMVVRDEEHDCLRSTGN